MIDLLIVLAAILIAGLSAAILLLLYLAWIATRMEDSE